MIREEPTSASGGLGTGKVTGAASAAREVAARHAGARHRDGRRAVAMVDARAGMNAPPARAHALRPHPPRMPRAAAFAAPKADTPAFESGSCQQRFSFNLPDQVFCFQSSAHYLTCQHQTQTYRPFSPPRRPRTSFRRKSRFLGPVFAPLFQRKPFVNQATFAPRRFTTLFAESMAIGRKPNGGTDRMALTPDDCAHRSWFVKQLREVGAEVRIDAAGNIFGLFTWDNSAPYILCGSHLDSQENGGVLDGAYGVVAALCAARRLTRPCARASLPRRQILPWSIGPTRRAPDSSRALWVAGCSRARCGFPM